MEWGIWTRVLPGKNVKPLTTVIEVFFFNQTIFGMGDLNQDIVWKNVKPLPIAIEGDWIKMNNGSILWYHQIKYINDSEKTSRYPSLNRKKDQNF